jgi:hypothetical protein
VRKRGIEAKWVVSFGAIHLSPKHLAYWVATDKDWERDQLIQDLTFRPACIRALVKCGYPKKFADFLGIAVESQETVDRECRGNWRTMMQ